MTNPRVLSLPPPSAFASRPPPGNNRINPQKTKKKQSKAFLSANPLLSTKLKAAVEEKLAAGGSHIIAEAGGGDVPSDSPSLAASAEAPGAAGGPAATETGDATAVAPPSHGADETEASSSPAEGEESDVAEAAVESDGGGVLLEPGVPSVEALFETDVFSKAGGKA